MDINDDDNDMWEQQQWELEYRMWIESLDKDEPEQQRLAEGIRGQSGFLQENDDA